MSHQKSHYHDKSASNVVVGVLIGLVLVLVGLLVLSNWESLTRPFTASSGQTGENTPTNDTDALSQSGEYFLGKEVSFSGILNKGGDLTSHTHTLTTTTELFGLKSNTFVLDDFVGKVIIGGTIDDYKNNMYIIKVNSIVSEQEEDDINTGNTKNTTLTGSTYIQEAGLFVENLSGTNIEMTIDSQNKRITFMKSQADNATLSGLTPQTFTIIYFPCDTTSNLRDCDNLQKLFQQTSQAGYTTTHGIPFYTVPETESLFGTLDNFFGYYLEAKDRRFLIEVMEYVHLVTTDYIEDRMRQTNYQLCTTGNSKLYDVSKTTLRQQDDTFFLDIVGNTSDNKLLTCEIKVDPTRTLGGIVEGIEITANTPTNTGEDTSSPEDGASQEETSADNTNTTSQGEENTTMTFLEEKGEQFPVYEKEEKQYTFDAKQEYSITFPSNNIRFSAYTLPKDERDLGHKNLVCDIKYHVIKYHQDTATNKSLVDTDPQLQMYRCVYDASLAQELQQDYIVLPYQDQETMFMINPLDQARVRFGKHISVTFGEE